MASSISVTGSLSATSGGSITVTWSGLNIRKFHSSYAGSVDYVGPYEFYIDRRFSDNATSALYKDGSRVVINTSSSSGSQTITFTAADIAYNDNRNSDTSWVVVPDSNYMSSYVQITWGDYTKYSGYHYVDFDSTSGSVSVTRTTLSAPGTPTITQNKTNFTLSWSAAAGSGGSGSVTYRVFSVTDGEYLTSASTATTATLSVPSYGYAYEYRIVAFYSGLESYSSTVSYTFSNPYPEITAQPTITSLSPAKGAQTTVTWSAAQVSNQQNYQILYQYFVGNSSTYSDNYHVGTTSETHATITQAMIQSKCGADFEGTCYIFARAYWTNADGTEQGGWVVPSGVAFTFEPHNTVWYHNGTSWVECIPYYHNGATWVECIPHYHNGTTWVECSAT